MSLCYGLSRFTPDQTVDYLISAASLVVCPESMWPCSAPYQHCLSIPDNAAAMLSSAASSVPLPTAPNTCFNVVAQHRACSGVNVMNDKAVWPALPLKIYYYKKMYVFTKKLTWQQITNKKFTCQSKPASDENFIKTFPFERRDERTYLNLQSCLWQHWLMLSDLHINSEDMAFDNIALLARVINIWFHWWLLS